VNQNNYGGKWLWADPGLWYGGRSARWYRGRCRDGRGPCRGILYMESVDLIVGASCELSAYSRSGNRLWLRG
jgi:hypothetical protein